jgi:hypothetical protein
MTRVALVALFLALCTGLAADPALADRISDIRNTKHNLSVTGPGEVRATTEDELCVYCHTPHGASKEPATPLWNRDLSGATYLPYQSSSLDAIGIGQPGGTSKLCLSCHDGTIAIGSVNVLNGASTDGDPATADITMTGTGLGGVIPEGAGENTGFTRRLGTDLTNDHPISFTYNDTLALQDGELRPPSATPEIDNRVPGVHPEVPLIDDQLQCTACHDPHIRDTIEQDIKFLRLNRFQQTEPQEGAFDIGRDQICLACHEKAGWVGSAHANSAVANEVYDSGAAALRDFASALPVWRAGCLNCHDTHTVEGARRLLREGTDSISSPKTGGASAIEETCYQCHSSNGGVLVGQGTTNFPVPDIEIDFQGLRHMPIDESPEVHDIGTGGEAQPGKDFLESRTLLGRGNDGNRHVECTDCHNPHRMIKNRLFNALPDIPDAAGTRDRGNTSTPSNLASGVLRGTWGVEPVYSGTQFLIPPISFGIKRGTPPVGGSTAASAAYVTREYQICLKCHSEYAYNEPPVLGLTFGGTPPGTNDMDRYTDQAMEFQAPIADKGEPGGNHRSWHPVIAETGRTTGIRDANANNWLEPFNDPALIGSQTMYCSDCHGSDTANGSIQPLDGENGRSWGPHGSSNDFILKGDWSSQTGSGQQDDLCFKCHSYSRYATRNGEDIASGFGGSKAPNLHGFHADKIGRLRCSWCHVAVPHGWKNKALLVNLNDVGAEAGLASGTQVRNNTTAGYTNGPYYLNAMLKVDTFATSGNWQENNCGSSGPPGNGQTGRDWMRDSNENCENPP